MFIKNLPNWIWLSRRLVFFMGAANLLLRLNNYSHAVLMVFFLLLKHLAPDQLILHFDWDQSCRIWMLRHTASMSASVCDALLGYCLFLLVNLIKQLLFEPTKPILNIRLNHLYKWRLNTRASLHLHLTPRPPALLSACSSITLTGLKPTFISFSAVEHESDNQLIKSFSWSGDE